MLVVSSLHFLKYDYKLELWEMWQKDYVMTVISLISVPRSSFFICPCLRYLWLWFLHQNMVYLKDNISSSVLCLMVYRVGMGTYEGRTHPLGGQLRFTDHISIFWPYSCPLCNIYCTFPNIIPSSLPSLILSTPGLPGFQRLFWHLATVWSTQQHHPT